VEWVGFYVLIDLATIRLRLRRSKRWRNALKTWHQAGLKAFGGVINGG